MNDPISANGSCVCDSVAVEALTFPPSSGKSFIMGSDEALESELGLGELAGLTVANEAENLSYDVSTGLLPRSKTKTSVPAIQKPSQTPAGLRRRIVNGRKSVHSPFIHPPQNMAYHLKHVSSTNFTSPLALMLT